MRPACSHTGTPSIPFDGFLHFTASTTSGSAALMRLRTRASVSPRQSPSAWILASTSWEGEGSPSLRRLWFMDVVAPGGGSHAFAGQPAGLLHPVSELELVERVVLVDVEVAHVLLPGDRKSTRLNSSHTVISY